jgi:hypothetical protein
VWGLDGFLNGDGVLDFARRHRTACKFGSRRANGRVGDGQTAGAGYGGLWLPTIWCSA